MDDFVRSGEASDEVHAARPDSPDYKFLKMSLTDTERKWYWLLRAAAEGAGTPIEEWKAVIRFPSSNGPVLVECAWPHIDIDHEIELSAEESPEEWITRRGDLEGADVRPPACGGFVGEVTPRRCP